MRFTGPTGPFHAAVAIPGDKSLSHRALFLAAMAAGRSRIRSLGPGADVASTAAALRSFGAAITADGVDSPGIESWAPAPGVIDAGNSATTMRVLAGAVAGRSFVTTIAGDPSLMRRPMARVADPLRALGAAVSTSPDGRPPLVVEGGRLRGAAIEIPIPSAQVRTAVALAALQAEGPTVMWSPPGHRDHTERWLSHLGLGRARSDGFEIRPGPVPVIDVDLPGDPSSAGFVWVAAAVQPGSTVLTERVSLNSGRVGLLKILEAMGAEVTVTITGDVLGDPVGDVGVTGGALRGIELSGIATLGALDELPALSVAAAYGDGPTSVVDAAELRLKETDRIAAIVAMIRALGGEATEAPDGFTIEPVPLTGGTVSSRGDHRIAMAAAVAAGRGAPVVVEGFEAAGVSWPGFELALEAMWSSR